MATTKPPSTQTAMLLVFAVVSVILLLSHQVQAQAGGSCSSTISSLNVCAPFVVPGVANAPNADCCSALSSIDHDCLCSTLRISAQLPSQCNLTPLTCPTN